MSSGFGGRFSGDSGYQSREDDVEIPGPIREARDNASYWRQAVGVAEDAATLDADFTEAADIPGPQEAITFYHQWVLEYHNRLRDYEHQINGPKATKWWDERNIAIRTWRGHDHIEVTVRAGALDLLNEILGRDDDNEIEQGTTVTLRSFTGLRSLIFARRIRSEVTTGAGTARNPSKTTRAIVPDWLDAETLTACHDGLLAVTADLGFVPKVKTVSIEDDEPLTHGE